MKNVRILSFLFILIFGISNTGFCFFDAQALVGKRNAEISSKETKGDELTLAVHIDPIPLVPVGFGLSLSHINFSGQKDSLEFYFDDVVGLDYVFEVMAWLPVGIAGFTPYAKYGITIGGAYKFKGLGTDTTSTNPEDHTYKPEGNNISIGVNWSPIPLIGILLEYKVSDQKLKKSGAPTETYKSNSILLGVEVGI